MEMGKICYDLNLNIHGMGLVLYSEGAVQNLVEGEKFPSGTTWQSGKENSHVD